MRETPPAVTAGAIHSRIPRIWRKAAIFAAVIIGAIIAGQLLHNEPLRAQLIFWDHGPKIEVVEASYGGNCRSFVPPEPYSNIFEEGNATQAVDRTCTGRVSCDYSVSASRLGDPVNACAKDFSVQYRCTGDDTLRSAAIPGEADGRRVRLNCREN